VKSPTTSLSSHATDLLLLSLRSRDQALLPPPTERVRAELNRIGGWQPRRISSYLTVKFLRFG